MFALCASKPFQPELVKKKGLRPKLCDHSSVLVPRFPMHGFLLTLWQNIKNKDGEPPSGFPLRNLTSVPYTTANGALFCFVLNWEAHNSRVGLFNFRLSYLYKVLPSMPLKIIFLGILSLPTECNSVHDITTYQTFRDSYLISSKFSLVLKGSEFIF